MIFNSSQSSRNAKKYYVFVVTNIMYWPVFGHENLLCRVDYDEIFEPMKLNVFH